MFNQLTETQLDDFTEENRYLNDMILDSKKNKQILDSTFSILSSKYISNFFQLRVRHKHNDIFQFQSNFNLNEIYDLTHSPIWENLLSKIKINQYLNISKFDDSTPSIGQSDYIFSLKKEYPDFIDIFSFVINYEYNQLSHQKQLLIFEKLNSFINLITLNTHLSHPISIENNIIVPERSKNKLEKYLKDQYEISLIEYRYLQAISLGGSSKQIAQVIQKSPRTIEKQIRDLCKKFNLSCKSSLQTLAEAIINSLHFQFNS